MLSDLSASNLNRASFPIAVRTLEISKPLVICDAWLLFDGPWRLRLVWMKLCWYGVAGLGRDMGALGM